MRAKSLVFQTLAAITAAILLASSPYANAANKTQTLSEEVHHQLVTLPYYSVFDWLQAGIKPDGTVTLIGEVTRPSLKDDAESRVQKVEGASRVVDNVEVLQLSSMDDQLRIALYRSIYSFNSPLFRYATQSLPPIHIIVRNGQVVLKGIVASQEDSDIAILAANQVPDVFSIKNELQIEGRVKKPIS
jgi:hyperosmotically inducible protein